MINLKAFDDETRPLILLSYIVSHLQEEQAIPTHSQLAKYFCISISTVRIIIEDLIDEGYLEKVRAGQYSKFKLKGHKVKVYRTK